MPWMKELDFYVILWNTQPHPLEVSEAPQVAVSLHLWYQHSTVRLMPRIWRIISSTIINPYKISFYSTLLFWWGNPSPNKIKNRYYNMSWCCCCWPVGSIIFRSAGNILWILWEIILLNFWLYEFRFGSSRTWTWSSFAVLFLLLWFMAGCGCRIWVFPQNALISLLVLPICEDLRLRTEEGQSIFYLGLKCAE